MDFLKTQGFFYKNVVKTLDVFCKTPMETLRLL